MSKMWYEKMTAKTVITMEEKPFSAPTEYTFRNAEGDEIRVEDHNYRQARNKLNKITGNKKGYKLIQRLL